MALKLDGDLVLAGAGNMGGAMLAGWLASGVDPKRVVVQDPSPAPAVKVLLDKHGIAVHEALPDRGAPPAVLLMAVKPQVMDEVFPPLAKRAGPDTVVLSIAAGKTIAGFEKHLADGIGVVRSIPNTPAAVGRGITVAAPNTHVTARQRALCDALLSAIGEVAWVDDEALIDPVTAVSGSGPAYVFYLTECLAAAGVKAGLEPDLAMRLARATVTGSGELMHKWADTGADQLRKNVTSPNGTTHAALQVLMRDNGLEVLMAEAIAAATARSRELAS
ncbi:MAG: pyrroline-5-carboxylate reductase [Hyphomicrobiaceae bacterium]